MPEQQRLRPEGYVVLFSFALTGSISAITCDDIFILLLYVPLMQSQWAKSLKKQSLGVYF